MVIMYFIITLLVGAFLVYCSAIKDPDFKDYIRDPWW